jgi:hypothetical protein
MTGICLELCCAPDDSTWNSDERSLYALAREGVARLGLGFDAARLEGIGVRRLRHAYPIYGRGDPDARDSVLASLRRLRNLLTRGRQGEFRYNVFTYESYGIAQETTQEVLNRLRERDLRVSRNAALAPKPIP